MVQVGAAPSTVSTKAKVFQIKTPLRTIILKARHEVDAEVRDRRATCIDARPRVLRILSVGLTLALAIPQEWMGHICAVQQGIPKDSRDTKLRKFDVYDDDLAAMLKVRQRLHTGWHESGTRPRSLARSTASHTNLTRTLS